MAQHPAEQRLETDLAIAEETLLEAGQVMPSFVVMAPGKRLLVPAPAEDADIKAIYYNLLRLLCHAENAFSVTMIAEAWIRMERFRGRESVEECARRVNNIRPSQAPDRLEVIFAASCARSGDGKQHVAIGTRLIVRDTDGRPTGTAPDPFPEGGIPYDAALAHLLPATPLSVEQQWAARQQLIGVQAASGIYLKPAVLPDLP